MMLVIKGPETFLLSSFQHSVRTCFAALHNEVGTNIYFGRSNSAQS